MSCILLFSFKSLFDFLITFSLKNPEAGLSNVINHHPFRQELNWGGGLSSGEQKVWKCFYIRRLQIAPQKLCLQGVFGLGHTHTLTLTGYCYSQLPLGCSQFPLVPWPVSLSLRLWPPLTKYRPSLQHPKYFLSVFLSRMLPTIVSLLK